MTGSFPALSEAVADMTGPIPVVTGPNPVIDEPPADDDLRGTVHEFDLDEFDVDAVRTEHEPAPPATGPEQEPARRQLVSTGTGSFPSLGD